MPNDGVSVPTMTPSLSTDTLEITRMLGLILNELEKIKKSVDKLKQEIHFDWNKVMCNSKID